MWALLAASTASAAIVEVPFAGTITSVFSSSPIVPGMTFEAVLRYDSDALPTSTFFDQSATYTNAATLHLEIGGSVFDWETNTTLSIGQGFTIGRPSFSLSPADFLSFSADNPTATGPLAGVPGYIDVMFATTDPGWITNVASLPESFLELGEFQGRDLFVNLAIGGSAVGVIDAAVPEPSTVPLAITGAVVLASIRRARSRSGSANAAERR